MLFCAVIADRHRNAIPAEMADLPLAAGALARFSELVRTCAVIPEPAHMGHLVETLKLYVATSLRAGVPPIPKLHLTLHLVERSWFTEKPKCKRADFRISVTKKHLP